MKRRVAGLVTMSLVLAGLVATDPKVGASQTAYCMNSSTLNRSQCIGYFTGTANKGTLNIDKIVSNNNASLLDVNSGSAFTTQVSQMLNSSGSQQADAAFLVDAMLNRFGTDYTSVSSGVAYAKAQFAVWSDLINDYGQGVRGSVDWNANNVPTSFIAPFQDSGRVIGGAKDDEIFYTKQHNESHPVITFFSQNGTTLKINKESGSIIGDLHPLQLKVEVYYPQVTDQQLQDAHNITAAQGVVKSFDGTTLVFVIDNPKQTVSLTVSSSTTYTNGIMYDSATANGLKAGSHAIVSYDIKTGNVTRVAYGL